MPAEKAPTRASEARRSTKPIMEKRRRARINNSLTELKNLILDALKKDNARHSKLEKADILEMTVKHLQNLQQRQTSPEPLSKYRAGFNECASEVSRYLNREGVDPLVQQRLMSHLSTCLSKPVHQPVHVQVPAVGPVNLSASSQAPHKEQHSLQVVAAARLPSGGIAFLLPPGSPYSNADSSSSSALSPVSLMGSSGILSPASSDRSTPSPVMSCARMVQPVSEPVWRPW